MSQLFTTELLPVSDRIDAWQWNAQKICGDCRIQLPRARFHGSIEVREVGDLRLTKFSSSPLSFWKWPLDSISSDNRCCVVITQLAGARLYRQNGAEVLLNAGDSTVIDAGHPWSSSCETDCVRLYLRVPRWLMQDRLRTREVPVVRKISGASRVGEVLSRLSQSLYDEAGSMDEEERGSALDAYFQTLSACVGRSFVAERCGELAERILRFIDGHIAESTLSPSEVAAAMGISLRHLHRIFSSTGTTMGDYVRARRLEQCREDLLNPRFHERSITDIAFGWGFSDAAHFSHSFRKQFGVSPRSFRTKSADAVQ